jgi:hypothetical protein
VGQRMVMPSQPPPLAGQATANQNLLHAVPATGNQHLLPVEQVKVKANLKHLPAVPNNEPAKSKDFKVPGHAI